MLQGFPLRLGTGAVRVLRRLAAMLFDALLNHGMGDSQKTVHKTRECLELVRRHWFDCT